MTSKPLISAVINTYNEAPLLAKCLKSLQGFANETIVIDMNSSDDTVNIAKSYGAHVYPHRWLKVVEPARNFGLSKTNGQWIIILDPDEYLTKSLKAELLSITHRQDIDFVKIPRKNFIFGKWIRHSNSWPDYLIRFFRKGTVNWQDEVHSQPLTKGNGYTIIDSGKLAINHQNYTSINDFVSKALRYATVRADELNSLDYKLKVSDFLLRPVQEFNSRFFAAEGYRDGLHGLIFSLLQSVSILFVYVKLWEKQGLPDKTLPRESFVSASQESTYEYGYWFTRYFIGEYSGNPFKTTLIRIRLFFDRITKNF